MPTFHEPAEDVSEEEARALVAAFARVGPDPMVS